jgi:hypothetical protein
MRNQPEMENLEGAMGVAAAYAIRDGISARRVDLRKVQKRLTEVGTLLPEMLIRQIKDDPLDEAAIRALVKQLGGRHLSAWEDVPMAREGSPRYREKIPFVEICTADPALAAPRWLKPRVIASFGWPRRWLSTLKNQSAKKGFQIDFDLEKCALTEVTLARTLAPLGSTERYDTLIDDLDDNRANIAEFAHMSLGN